METSFEVFKKVTFSIYDTVINKKIIVDVNWMYISFSAEHPQTFQKP